MCRVFVGCGNFRRKKKFFQKRRKFEDAIDALTILKNIIAYIHVRTPPRPSRELPDLPTNLCVSVFECITNMGIALDPESRVSWRRHGGGINYGFGFGGSFVCCKQCKTNVQKTRFVYEAAANYRSVLYMILYSATFVKRFTCTIKNDRYTTPCVDCRQWHFPKDIRPFVTRPSFLSDVFGHRFRTNIFHSTFIEQTVFHPPTVWWSLRTV